MKRIICSVLSVAEFVLLIAKIEWLKSFFATQYMSVWVYAIPIVIIVNIVLFSVIFPEVKR